MKYKDRIEKLSTGMTAEQIRQNKCERSKARNINRRAERRERAESLAESGQTGMRQAVKSGKLEAEEALIDLQNKTFVRESAVRWLTNRL
jgi:predicted naringenin-chalcone synthase